MSGFAGILRLDGAPLERSADPILDAMGSGFKRRGLGARRVIRHGAVGLVVPADRPSEFALPFVGAERELLVAFDGQLSDHGSSRSAFPGDADTAVLASLYLSHGAHIVDRLAGRFALAVWDPRHETLLLARDRFGVRSLVYALVDCERGELLLFGSEVAALMMHPDCPRAVESGTFVVADARSGTLMSHRYCSSALRSGETLSSDGRAYQPVVDGTGIPSR